MEKQLLGLMYMLSRDMSYHHVPNRNTRRADKTTFKVPSKIRPIYERSPYYRGNSEDDLIKYKKKQKKKAAKCGTS